MDNNIELTPGSVAAVQEFVAAKIKERGFEDETVQETLLLLTEEVGELVRACRRVTGMNVDTAKAADSTVGAEVADVINLIFGVGVKLGLDIEQEFINKNNLVDQRRYGRSRETV